MSTKKSDAQRFMEKLRGGPLTFAAIIESTRLGEEMSQVDFAKQLGISASHLCDIEKGRKTVSPARAAKFAKILGYSEALYVQYALQALIDQEGLKYKVDIRSA